VGSCKLHVSPRDAHDYSLKLRPCCAQISTDWHLGGSVLDWKLADAPELGYFNSDRPFPRGELLVKTATMIKGYYRNDKARGAARAACGGVRAARPWTDGMRRNACATIRRDAYAHCRQAGVRTGRGLGADAEARPCGAGDRPALHARGLLQDGRHRAAGGRRPRGLDRPPEERAQARAGRVRQPGPPGGRLPGRQQPHPAGALIRRHVHAQRSLRLGLPARQTHAAAPVGLSTGRRACSACAVPAGGGRADAAGLRAGLPVRQQPARIHPGGGGAVPRRAAPWLAPCLQSCACSPRRARASGGRLLFQHSPEVPVSTPTCGACKRMPAACAVVTACGQT